MKFDATKLDNLSGKQLDEYGESFGVTRYQGLGTAESDEEYRKSIVKYQAKQEQEQTFNKDIEYIKDGYIKNGYIYKDYKYNIQNEYIYKDYKYNIQNEYIYKDYKNMPKKQTIYANYPLFAVVKSLPGTEGYFSICVNDSDQPCIATTFEKAKAMQERSGYIGDRYSVVNILEFSGTIVKDYSNK